MIITFLQDKDDDEERHPSIVTCKQKRAGDSTAVNPEIVGFCKLEIGGVTPSLNQVYVAPAIDGAIKFTTSPSQMGPSCS